MCSQSTDVGRRAFLKGTAWMGFAALAGGAAGSPATADDDASGTAAGTAPQMSADTRPGRLIVSAPVLQNAAETSIGVAFAEHAKRLRAPEFPAGTKVVVKEMDALNRGGKSKDGKKKLASERKPSFKVTVPTAQPDDKARLFSLEFTAKTADGKSQTKLVLAEGYNHSLKHKKAKSQQTCYFRKNELGEGDAVFTITPMNSFGVRGKALVCEYKVRTGEMF